jgi:hypothetical protein
MAKLITSTFIGVLLAPAVAPSPCFAQAQNTRAPASKAASIRWCKPPINVQELRVFVERAEREHRTFQLSLKQLTGEVAAAQRDGTDPHELLQGLNFVFGAVVVGRGEDGDVILLGMHDPARSLDVEGLATAIQLVANGQDRATFSFEPDKEPNFRRTKLEGISRKSGIAERMLEAATTIEALATGTTRDNILSSYFQRLLKTKARKHRGQTEPTKKVISWSLTRSLEEREARSIILTRGKGGPVEMVLMTRNPIILRPEGDLRGKNSSSAPAREATQFAAEATARMVRLQAKYKSLGDLAAFVRIVDVLAHVRRLARTPIPGENFWLNEYKMSGEGLPERIEMQEQPATSDSLRAFGTTIRPQAVPLRVSVRIPVALDASLIPTVVAADVIGRVLDSSPLSPRVSQNAPTDVSAIHTRAQ